MKRILLADLDTPVFAAASVSETRSIDVLHIPTGLHKSFSTRTEFKNRLKEINRLERLNEYEVKDVQETEPIENACHTLKAMMKQYIELTQSDEVLYFISGKDNFRDSLKLPSKYKSSRVDKIRPLLLPDVKRFAINKFKPMICDGQEPDDVIVWKGYELLREGHYPILLSIDKDSLAYSGLHLFNQKHPEFGVITLPDFGYLEVNTKREVKGKGFLWFCFQLLMGDATDSFKPCELAKVKFGEISVYNVLKDCKTEHEALTCVLKQYKDWYPNPVVYRDWTGQLQTKNYIELADLYFKCCRMKSTKDDDLDFVKFCKSYGVDL